METFNWLQPQCFAGKVAFITGGGSGINLGIAKMFAKLGASVAICGRSEERLKNAAQELREFGGSVSTSIADVRDYDAVAAALATTERELGPVDILICGAAGNFVARAEAMSAKGFRTVVDIDLFGSFNAAHAAFEQLKKTRGVIIFISAGQAYLPFSQQAHVGAAKAGVENLMRNLALEWGRFGIRSNSVVPGPIEGTEGMKRLTESADHDTWRRTVPLGRFGQPEEIGGVVAMLSSPLCGYVTGAQVIVDGGYGLQGSGFFNQSLENPSKAD